MKKRILVADDEESIIDLVECSLEPAGYQVLSTVNGAQLPALIKAERPDLLILDVMLPGLDGYSAQIQLAQDEATRDIPVIVITALPAARSLFETLPQVKGFLRKPFDTAVLLKNVREVLGDKP